MMFCVVVVVVLLLLLLLLLLLVLVVVVLFSHIYVHSFNAKKGIGLRMRRRKSVTEMAVDKVTKAINGSAEDEVSVATDADSCCQFERAQSTVALCSELGLIKAREKCCELAFCCWASVGCQTDRSTFEMKWNRLVSEFRGTL
jgi:hypothetical protein